MNVGRACPRPSDRRRNRRFTVNLRVGFEWAVEGHPSKRGRGTIRDISTSGVYLATRTALPVGARVLLEVEVPLLSARTREMHLQGAGPVVRAEKLGRGTVKPTWGIAAAVHFYPETSRKVMLTFASQNLPAS